jgi:excisionase family DNA binding protein
MGRMLGLKKTESYYLLHKHHFETVTINHQLRVVRASFEQWYEHQDKYRKVDGPEPGAMLRTQFYSVAEIADMLSLSDDSTRDLIRNQRWPTLIVAGRLRVPKKVFDQWYASQHRYRNSADRERDRLAEEASMTVPDMGRLLGIDRRQAWQLYRHAKDQLVLIRVAEKPRITRESLDKWYADQKGIQPASESSHCHEKAVETEHKEYITIHEAAEYLGISEKRVYRLVENGTFSGKKIGKTRLIRYTDVANYEKED